MQLYWPDNEVIEKDLVRPSILLVIMKWDYSLRDTLRCNWSALKRVIIFSTYPHVLPISGLEIW